MAILPGSPAANNDSEAEGFGKEGGYFERLGTTQIRLIDILNELLLNDETGENAFPDGGQKLLNVIRHKVGAMSKEEQLKIHHYASENFVICKNIIEGFSYTRYQVPDMSASDLEKKMYERYVELVQRIPLIDTSLTFAYKANCYIYRKIEEEKKKKVADEKTRAAVLVPNPKSVAAPSLATEVKEKKGEGLFSLPFEEIQPTFQELRSGFRENMLSAEVFQKYAGYMEAHALSSESYKEEIEQRLKQGERSKRSSMAIYSEDDDADKLATAVHYIRKYLEMHIVMTPELSPNEPEKAKMFLYDMIQWVLLKFDYLTPTEAIRVATACYKYYHNARTMSYLQEKYTPSQYKKVFMEHYLGERGNQYEDLFWVSFEPDSVVMEINDRLLFDKIYKMFMGEQQDTQNTAGSHITLGNGLHIILLDLTKPDPNEDIKLHEHQHKENHIYFPELFFEEDEILNILLKKGVDEVLAKMKGGGNRHAAVAHMRQETYNYLNHQRYGLMFVEPSPGIGNIRFCDRGYYARKLREQYEQKIHACIYAAYDLRNAFRYYNGGEAPQQFYTFLLAHPPMERDSLIDTYLLDNFGVSRERCDSINARLHETFSYSFFCFLKQYEPIFFASFAHAIATGDTQSLLALEDLHYKDDTFEGRTALLDHDYRRMLNYKEEQLNGKLGFGMSR